MDRMAEVPGNPWRREFGLSVDHPRTSAAGTSVSICHLKSEVAGPPLLRSAIVLGGAGVLPTDHATSDVPSMSSLTRREREVLTLLCERLTDVEIAQRLTISRRTVSTHVSNILGKLGATNRRRAGALAIQHGLV